MEALDVVGNFDTEISLNAHRKGSLVDVHWT